MTNLKKKATINLINSITNQEALKQRLLEIIEEVNRKMENGIPAPHRLELEFEQISVQMGVMLSKQAEAENILGFKKSTTFIFN
jgi:hypothetical protein